MEEDAHVGFPVSAFIVFFYSEDGTWRWTGNNSVSSPHHQVPSRRNLPHSTRLQFDTTTSISVRGRWKQCKNELTKNSDQRGREDGRFCY
jgi:hypothetical protein